MFSDLKAGHPVDGDAVDERQADSDGHLHNEAGEKVRDDVVHAIQSLDVELLYEHFSENNLRQTKFNSLEHVRRKSAQ